LHDQLAEFVKSYLPILFRSDPIGILRAETRQQKHVLQSNFLKAN
jgi:hypothetical protein